jgi:hypothetical protein
MKLKLKRRRFDSVKEIQTVSQDMMKALTRNYFQECFRSWKLLPGVFSVMEITSRGVFGKGNYFQECFRSWKLLPGVFSVMEITSRSVFGHGNYFQGCFR